MRLPLRACLLVFGLLGLFIAAADRTIGEEPAKAGNPIFPGWYADPEGAIFGDRYWIYPTYSAPFDEQLHMDAFSSPDLVQWTKHPRIVDNQAIRWARRAMWAPAIVEKGGKYYLFFAANDIHDDQKEIGGIGVAVADRPQGPFKDYLGKPLLGKIHNGAQPIDQFVFKDKDGLYYMIYGGWGHCNICRLNDDFTGFLPLADGTTFKEITPEGYVEGPFMFIKNGKYYFMWSEGGWGGPHYCVAYAIADSPFGPFKRIGKILQQDPKVATGAGHHSVIHVPQDDAWYIVYHRRPLGETDANHRATCIDRMEFDDKGFIKPVTITKEGVARHPLTKANANANAERWGLWQTAIEGPKDGNPNVDVQFSAVFTQGSEKLTVPGFYDGDGVFRVRFSPPTEGQWEYTTRSNRPELDGKRGSLSAGPASAGNRGPVRVAHTHHFAYADGTPYFQVGTTCYAWVHQTDALQQQTLKTLAASPFNKIRFCVFPKAYTYNKNEPSLFAFQRGADGKFDFTRPDPAFWRHLERRIADLQAVGIEADLILWHPYDRWGFAEMGDENDDRYLRYCIARLAGYRNLWWSLANEYDLMAPRAMQGHRGEKTMDDWDRFFQILENEDPYARLRSIHNCRGFYDYKKSWVTHASIQRHDLPSVLGWRKEFNKPIVIDECGYEGNVPQGWGNLSAEEVLRRFWIGTMRGGYVGHGETYMHPEDILWWSKGGVLHGQSPARIAFLRQLMSAIPFHEFTPIEEPSPGVYGLVKPGEMTWLYFAQPGEVSLELPGKTAYKVDGIDAWKRTVTPLGSAEPGKFTFRAPSGNYLLRLTAYKPGEKQRPKIEAAAAPDEGIAPLKVAFSAKTSLPAAWDFGDGTTAAGPQATHVYQKPGLYTASVTVGEGDAASTAFVPVAVDRAVLEPIVRVGFSSGETVGVKLHGPVKRSSEGVFTLPGKEPFGWIAVGEKPLGDVEGLRSFTILGWVKPSSLATGAGGNRIVFCLNHRTSGFDLVHHADGRLRLAVNEWPDNVKNDSSPGKLQPGKWALFAVTYDATKPEQNVRWYFGDEQTPLALDRATTYSVGPVKPGVGPLAIGNFNPTMHYGLDRQFRGEIRGLVIYGSRVGFRGALDLDALQKAAGD